MAPAGDPMAGVMDGVRVLEVASWVFVPGAGAVLADWGADVIKIEHPERGDPQRGLVSISALGADTVPTVNFMVEQPNRGKRSVALDISTEQGRGLLLRLAASCDVFLTNLLPAARTKLRIDVDDVRAANPDIIYVRGSSFGPNGEEADRGGYDASAYYARGSIGYALTPPECETPALQRPGFGDLPSGMMLAGGIAAALFRRERTGAASVVDASLLSCAMWSGAFDIVASKFVGQLVRYPRAEAPNPIVNNYRTGDGRALILVMMQADRFWGDLCERIGRPDLVDDPRFADAQQRYVNRAECVAELDKTFAGRTLSEWKEALAGAQGVWAAYQTPAEIHDDPQALTNGYLPELESASGDRFTLVGAPVQFEETSPALRPAPEHGAHTEEVLLELGLTWEDLAAHKATGTIL